MDRDEDIKKVLQVINSQIKNQGATFEVDIEKEPEQPGI
jgi:hypothetical protein